MVVSAHSSAAWCRCPGAADYRSEVDRAARSLGSASGGRDAVSGNRFMTTSSRIMPGSDLNASDRIAEWRVVGDAAVPIVTDIAVTGADVGPRKLRRDAAARQDVVRLDCGRLGIADFLIGEPGQHAAFHITAVMTKAVLLALSASKSTCSIMSPTIDAFRRGTSRSALPKGRSDRCKNAGHCRGRGRDSPRVGK